MLGTAVVVRRSIGVQRDQRVHPRRPPHWQYTRRDRHGDQQERDGDHGDRVARLDRHQPESGKLREPQRRRQTDQKAQRYLHESAAQEQPRDVAPLAPTAMRTPISCVRCVTAYAITP